MNYDFAHAGVHTVLGGAGNSEGPHGRMVRTTRAHCVLLHKNNLAINELVWEANFKCP